MAPSRNGPAHPQYRSGNRSAGGLPKYTHHHLPTPGTG